MDLNTPISQLSRIGKTTAKRLNYLGVKTAKDLLYWLPFRYEDYRSIAPISGLRDGNLVTVKVKIELIANKRSFRKRKIVTEALVADESGGLRVIWFNQPYITKNLKIGDRVFLSGKVKSDVLGSQMVSPTYEKADKNETAHTARLVPIYSTTTGLTQKQIRYFISQIINLSSKISDWLPESFLEKYDLVTLADAIQGIHFPVDEQDLRQCTDRLKFDELIFPQLKSEIIRRSRMKESAPKIEFKEKEIKEFVGSLPFTLTKTQKIAAWEIIKDMNSGTPMNRMLSGDVGSGKTIVAALAALNAALNNYQIAVMAPTEILAMQHYGTMNKLLGERFTVALLTRSQFLISNSEFLNKSKLSNSQIQKQVIKTIEDGVAQIIIGTHALLSEKVEFNDVGLVVVDEQHRFGVEQRKAIKDKTADITAHYLSMTATPIPRSLALMIYGDLDLSIINELPPGRKPIITRLVEPKNRDKAYDFIRDQVKRGRQVFVICPLIEEEAESFKPLNYNHFAGTEKKSVMSEFAKLTKNIFPDLRVGFLHGKLKPAEKEMTMEKFKKNELDILVSTSVVEVGVDIPNASVMMVEGAERFGMAQLHQFRGRVGRSVYQSYCLLFTDSDSRKTLDRLSYFEKNLDGFKLAEKDLETRGPGEVYGTEQSGLKNMRLAKLTDKDLIKKTREAAVYLADNLAKYPGISRKMAVWEKEVHLE